MFRKINIFILLCLKTLIENNLKLKRIYFPTAQAQLSITMGQHTKNYQNSIEKKDREEESLRMNH